MNNSYSNLEQLISVQGQAVIAPVGGSMLPFLKEGRDAVLLKKCEEPPKKYDIVLYRDRRTGGYVLHRIIRADAGEYIICGDNCSAWERGYTADDLIAVADKIITDGKQTDCHCLKNRIYERIWCGTLLKRIVYKLRRCSQHTMRF